MDAQNYMVIKNQQNEDEILGKFIYFTLANVQVHKDDIARICQQMKFPYRERRISKVDTFHNATGSIAKRLTVETGGVQEIIRVYCRDNRTRGSVYSRELVREMVGHDTNQYEKLANLCYDKETERIYYENLVSYDPYVDAAEYCSEAIRLFHIYQDCFGRSQIDTLLQHYLDAMDAVPISVRGKFFFIPRHEMAKADLFEDFIEALNTVNQNRDNTLVVNSFFVADDEKQREKMKTEFYNLIREEMQVYEERAQHLIQSGCQSSVIMERLVLRMRDLENKLHRFEELFHQELDEVKSEFGTMNLYSQELQARATGVRMQKAA